MQLREERAALAGRRPAERKIKQSEELERAKSFALRAARKVAREGLQEREHWAEE